MSGKENCDFSEQFKLQTFWTNCLCDFLRKFPL